jgi:uncharacterized protein (DUF2164 family)
MKEKIKLTKEKRDEMICAIKDYFSRVITESNV